jgi:hypothetical protein
MNGVLNPVDIEKTIQDISRRIHQGVPIVSNAETKAREATHALDLAIARAYMAHEGPAHEKKYAAVIATEKERSAADEAEVAFRYAERTARALESELRAQQSIGASIRSMYAGERGFGG